MKKTLLTAFALTCSAGTALANDTTPRAATHTASAIDTQRRIIPLEITITKGYWTDVKELPGSGYYLSEKQLAASGTTDINRIMKQVPGINVQEEDGFGLRPNIGMRGGRIDRSADITLMEDSILIAPAPYAAPEAYYFPRMERMTGVEVRKGSSTVKYGPRTTNGAVNLLTRSVPDLAGGEVSGAIGSYGGVRMGAHGGTSATRDYGSFGVLAEFSHESSDGFKDIDTVGGDTGFNITDYMTKLRFKSNAGSELYQEVEVKLGYTDEDSNETYLGLTSTDFNINPYRRYAASQVDHMDAFHHQAQITHYIEPIHNVGVTTTLYRNDFDRNWYKLNNVRSGTNLSIADVLNNPITNAAHLAILQGGNSAANGLTVRANIRSYYAQGIQTAVNYRSNWFGVHNDIETGLRYHYDVQDRLQHDDVYQMLNGRMILTSSGAPGTESNRIGRGKAVAGYVLDRIDFGKLAITPGLRYEYIDLRTDNYGTSDPERSGANLQRFASIITALIPGAGVEYDLTETWQLIGGIHKGFAPPEPPTNATAALNADKEESVNYEAGVRYRGTAMRAEAIGFFNDYKNLLGADTSSSGGGGGGDQFNGGEVNVWGLEAGLGYDLATLAAKPLPVRIPARVGYTYTQGEFQNSFNSSFAEWGNIQKGYELPYIAPHQLSLSLGVENNQWLVSVNAKYTDRMRTVAGKGALVENQSTDGSFTVDLHVEYEVARNLRPFVSVTNLLDEEYIAARRPAGARPGAPMMAYAGVKIGF